MHHQATTIKSHSRFDGVIADTLCTNTSQRYLNEAMKEQLKENISKKNDEVIVTSIIGDTEALTFATEIAAYLTKQGYKVKTSRALYNQPVLGQTIAREAKRVNIVIGRNV